ncbi:ankyrin repeat and LEM domain-containing protein 2-like [Watersipora subatra]|uniref:ankyrin repeat and LEM domain-containing protein 2-like n=1 Tax=Watersipora subatra TaxID=2589382 RepID=UPI00355B505D
MSHHEYDTATLFYGVQIPAGIVIPEGLVVERFYTDKTKALEILKKIKPARMKQFSTQEDAILFNSTQPDTPSQNEKGIGSGAETLPYPSLKLQDLVVLRQAIEKGNTDKIKELVESNPRYLISSGDTPTILQERYRYNALHSAALKGSLKAAEVILNYLSSPELFSRLYPTDTDERRERRMLFLIDLYLNTPDKGCNETPLHFAAKFGHFEVVKLLVNEVSIERDRLNRDGRTPAQVACTRVPKSSDSSKILEVLEGQCYIPLYRSEDDTLMPFVGDPWSPGCKSSPRARDPYAGPYTMLSPLRAAHQHKLAAMSSPSSPHKISQGMAVKAVAGPMSPKQASEFKRSWSSPRRPVNSKKRRLNGGGEIKQPYSDIIKTDPFKGLEFVGRNLARDMQVPWAEYWDFLGCSVDIGQEEGLQQLEDYLKGLEAAEADSMDLGSGDKQCAHSMQVHQSSHLGKSGSNSASEVIASPTTQLCEKFSTMSIHSPSSPSLSRARCETSSQSTSSRLLAGAMGDSSPPSSLTPIPQRTLLEYIVPNIVPAIDRLRRLWPFHKVSCPLSGTKPASFQTETIPQSNPAQMCHITQAYQPRKPVFIKGARPCKIDTDVLNALMSIDVDSAKFPAIDYWRKNVTSFPLEDRNRWQSLGTQRHRERLKHLQEEDSFKHRLVFD